MYFLYIHFFKFSGKSDKVAADIKAKGGEAISVPGDVTDPKFPDHVIKATIDAFGRLDILVNNAGYTWDGIAHRMTDKQWEVTSANLGHQRSFSIPLFSFFFRLLFIIIATVTVLFIFLQWFFKQQNPFYALIIYAFIVEMRRPCCWSTTPLRSV